MDSCHVRLAEKLSIDYRQGKGRLSGNGGNGIDGGRATTTGLWIVILITSKNKFQNYRM
jgi:hypothetical protein